MTALQAAKRLLDVGSSDRRKRQNREAQRKFREKKKRERAELQRKLQMYESRETLDTSAAPSIEDLSTTIHPQSPGRGATPTCSMREVMSLPAADTEQPVTAADVTDCTVAATSLFPDSTFVFPPLPDDETVAWNFNCIDGGVSTEITSRIDDPLQTDLALDGTWSCDWLRSLPCREQAGFLALKAAKSWELAAHRYDAAWRCLGQ